MILGPWFWKHLHKSISFAHRGGCFSPPPNSLFMPSLWTKNFLQAPRERNSFIHGYILWALFSPVASLFGKLAAWFSNRWHKPDSSQDVTPDSSLLFFLWQWSWSLLAFCIIHCPHTALNRNKSLIKDFFCVTSACLEIWTRKHVLN